MRVIGLMSGTSMDGIDAAVLETDGEDLVRTGAAITQPYDPGFRSRLRALLGTLGESPMAKDVERELTDLHGSVVKRLMEQERRTIDLVGFHGHTIHHDPSARLTKQIGDGKRLAQTLGIPVVNDFRSQDVAAGGQGAPLVPLYHRAIARGLKLPLAILNIGGVANVTYLDAGDPIAFDTGPGCALIDDLFLSRTGTPIDKDGQIAAKGKVDVGRLSKMLDHPYFSLHVPKSLDRDAFQVDVSDLDLPDAAATLVAFTAGSVQRGAGFFPMQPLRWLITGGGRHNVALLNGLRRVLSADIQTVEAVGWDGDALEAQAFAYLAVRSVKGLPVTLPTTTGVPTPLRGGTLHNP
jgi:anhydro-N-acetylmuramic acid kinase